MSNSLSSIAYCTILPEMPGLFNTFMSEVLVRTLTIWAKKYGRNFLVVLPTLMLISLNLGCKIQLWKCMADVVDGKLGIHFTSQ